MNLGALVADGSLLIAIPIAILAGAISFLSPCVLPLVPGYLGFIGGAVSARPAGSAARASKRRAEPAVSGAGATETAIEPGAVTPAPAGTVTADAEPARGRLVLGVLLFIAGFTVVFVSMAMLGGTLGRFLLEYQDLITRILGVVIIAMGLVFIGWFGMAQRIARPQVRGNLGLIGAPLLGIALGIGWAPCIGPTLAVILTMAFDSGSAARAALLGVAYSLGLGIPFLLLTLGFGWATRSVSFLRRHIRVVNLIGGAVLIVLGLLMVTGVWTAVMAQLQGVFASVPAPL
ncbi:cytochrome c biogenesis CcdA family protein [Microbacterium sp. NPDC056057]|uniref:cytochrome c biogenesis CcdA family protein n=1 Tax=Microbacterium sp. NPDC056057 TaxID=3345699 RepID=UPI0035D553F3